MPTWTDITSKIGYLDPLTDRWVLGDAIDCANWERTNWECRIKMDPKSWTDTMEFRFTYSHPTIKKVIFNEPATIVFWDDGTKTVVKCGEGDTFDPEKGIAMAYVKKVNGNKGNYNNIFRPWVEDYYKEKIHKDKLFGALFDEVVSLKEKLANLGFGKKQEE